VTKECEDALHSEAGRRGMLMLEDINERVRRIVGGKDAPAVNPAHQERWVLAIAVAHGYGPPPTPEALTFSSEADAMAASNLADVKCWPVKVAG